MSEEGAGVEGSSSEELENGINVSSSDDEDEDNVMESENVGDGKKMTNGHHNESDDMEED